MKTSVGKTNLLLYLALTVSLAAGLREGVRLHETIEEVSSLRDRVHSLDTYKKALLKHLSNMQLTPPFLTADVGFGPDSDGFLLEERVNAVLYLLSTECPVCPRNYPFLNTLSNSGVTVIGLAVDSTAVAVEKHISEWKISFPILVDPKGSAVEIVPRYATPTTVAVSREEVVFLEVGVMDPDSQRTLESITRAWIDNEKPFAVGVF